MAFIARLLYRKIIHVQGIVAFVPPNVGIHVRPSARCMAVVNPAVAVLALVVHDDVGKNVKLMPLRRVTAGDVHACIFIIFSQYLLLQFGMLRRQ